MAEKADSRTFVVRITAWALQRKPVRAFLLYGEQRGPMLADSITYRMLFAIFAAVLLGFSIAAIWLSGNPVAWQALVGAVDSVIPGLVGPDGLVNTSDIQAPDGFTLAGILSSIGLLGAAIGAVGQTRAALRSLGDQPRDDIFIVWAVLRNIGMAVGVAVAFGAAAGATFFGSALVDVLAGWLGIASENPFASWATWLVSVVVVFALDAAVVAAMFLVLSGVKPSARALWPGVLIGAFGLVVLQQLSGLFVGGARANPLLASFAALIALLIWFNLSSQVVLVSAAYILTGMEDERDRMRARYGAASFAARRVQRAEIAVQTATDELARARAAQNEEREKAGAGSIRTPT